MVSYYIFDFNVYNSSTTSIIRGFTLSMNNRLATECSYSNDTIYRTYDISTHSSELDLYVEIPRNSFYPLRIDEDSVRIRTLLSKLIFRTKKLLYLVKLNYQSLNGKNIQLKFHYIKMFEIESTIQKIRGSGSPTWVPGGVTILKTNFRI